MAPVVPEENTNLEDSRIWSKSIRAEENSARARRKRQLPIVTRRGPKKFFTNPLRRRGVRKDLIGKGKEKDGGGWRKTGVTPE